MFVLFLGLLGVGLGLAAYAGYKAHWLLSVIAVALSLALWQGLSLWMPGVTLVFLGLSLALASATVLASLTEKLSLGASWTTVGRGLLLFVLFSGWFVYSQVSTEKDRYFDLMLSGAVALGTGGNALSAASLQPMIDSALSGVTLDEAYFRSIVSEEDFYAQEATLLASCRDISVAMLTGSSACQTSLTSAYSATAMALADDHLISGAMYNQTIANMVAQAPAMKARLSSQAGTAMQAAMDRARSSASTIPPEQLRSTMIDAIPAMRLAYDQFPLAVAAAFATMLYSISLVPRLVGALVAWTMNKLIG
jgi:hypothetical protein